MDEADYQRGWLNMKAKTMGVTLDVPCIEIHREKRS